MFKGLVAKAASNSYRNRYRLAMRRAAFFGFDPRNSVDAHVRVWAGMNRLDSEVIAAFDRRRGPQAG